MKVGSIMAELNYSELTEEQLEIINEYCENNMKKLKNVCYMVWGNKGLPYMYHDDLYDDAMNVLVESVITYNSTNNTKFKTYLANNINLSQREWYRNTHLRAKRNNLELDKNGKIKKDKKGNPIIIKNISFNCLDEDGNDLYEKVSSGFKVENEIEDFSYTSLEDILEECSQEMREYLNVKLSKLQRKILELIINDFSKEEIIKTLNIDSALYSDSIAAITSNKNTRKLRKGIGVKSNVR